MSILNWCFCAHEFNNKPLLKSNQLNFQNPISSNSPMTSSFCTLPRHTSRHSQQYSILSIRYLYFIFHCCQIFFSEYQDLEFWALDLLNENLSCSKLNNPHSQLLKHISQISFKQVFRQVKKLEEF